MGVEMLWATGVAWAPTPPATRRWALTPAAARVLARCTAAGVDASATDIYEERECDCDHV